MYSDIVIMKDAPFKEFGFDSAETIGKEWKLVVGSKEAKKAKDRKIIVSVNDDVREVVERIKPMMICDVETSKRKDFIHHRNSGLNHIIAKLMQEKNVILGICFKTLLEAKGYRRAVLLGRIMQNIRLCRKYKVKMRIFTLASDRVGMRSAIDLMSLCRVLGMTAGEAKEALQD